MALPQVNPILIDQLIVVISGAFMECFSADEQAVIGTFLATLGSAISFNSVYALYIEGQMQSLKQDDNDKDTNDNEYELLQKSIEKIQEEISKIKANHSL